MAIEILITYCLARTEQKQCSKKKIQLLPRAKLLKIPQGRKRPCFTALLVSSCPTSTARMVQSSLNRVASTTSTIEVLIGPCYGK